MEVKIEHLAKEELKRIKSLWKTVESLRKKAVGHYLKNTSNQKLSDYILYLMGSEGKYYNYLNAKKTKQKSEHMGVETGYYLEEMIFDFLNEIILEKYQNKFEVVRQVNTVGTKNKKQDIIIQAKNKPIIVLEIKTFMGDDNRERMLKDKSQIEKAFKNKVHYFGYAPYLYSKDQSKSIEGNKKGWLFYGEIEPLITRIFTILDEFKK